MAMLDGLRVVFLEAISFADAKSREKMVKQWNEQCQEVYYYKNDLIAEEHYKATHNADVVPKSEVDKLKADLIVWKQDRFNLYQRLELYEITRQKVAREIFEDLQGLLIMRVGVTQAIAELKKKYTEGGDNK